MIARVIKYERFGRFRTIWEMPIIKMFQLLKAIATYHEIKNLNKGKFRLQFKIVGAWEELEE